jgi:hypothetical protein
MCNIEADEPRAAQGTCEADQQQGAISQARQIVPADVG